MCSLPPRYDVKGCQVSRWVEPGPEDSSIILVLKDLNFQGKTIQLGEPRLGMRGAEDALGPVLCPSPRALRLSNQAGWGLFPAPWLTS